jgi:hypothetical protein
MQAHIYWHTSRREAHEGLDGRGNGEFDFAHTFPDAIRHEFPSLKHPGPPWDDARQGC